MSGLTQSLLFPDWPAPASVRACVTTRQGGISLPPYETFNLGDHVGDDPAAVAENRRRLSDAFAIRPAWLKQVHGWWWRMPTLPWWPKPMPAGPTSLVLPVP